MDRVSKIKPSELNVFGEQPKFPQYALLIKRLESFDNWPIQHITKKDDLAAAGLVYTGVGDSVRCYFCGGGLRGWEKSDIPMEEHAKWYPRCQYISITKGPEYSNDLTKETVSASKPITVDDPLSSVAAQSCLFVGFEKKLVKKAIEIYLVNFKKKDFTGKELCEICLELEDEPDTTGDSKEESSSSEDELSLETLIEENDRLNEKFCCKICLDRPADTIILACGHMPACEICSYALVKCPICRGAIKSRFKVHFSAS